ncbi:MAG: GIY-YIG nuclease family protein [Ghiorsea sp.]
MNILSSKSKSEIFKYLIYQTTNKINGKYYIGQHKTKNINDRYLGSGTILKRSIKKYGKQNFVREILFIYDNFAEMDNKEREIVNEEFINRSDTYNMVQGGGTSYVMPEEIRKEARKKNGAKNKGKVVTKDASGAICRCSVDDPRYLSGELVGATKNNPISTETREKLSKASIERARFWDIHTSKIVRLNKNNSIPENCIHIWARSPSKIPVYLFGCHLFTNNTILKKFMRRFYSIRKSSWDKTPDKSAIIVREPNNGMHAQLKKDFHAKYAGKTLASAGLQFLGMLDKFDSTKYEFRQINERSTIDKPIDLY